MNKKARTTNFICSTLLVVLTASVMKCGKNPIVLAITSSIDFSSKISTGRHIFMMDFPAIRLEPICLRIVLMMPFCDLRIYSSWKTKF